MSLGNNHGGSSHGWGGSSSSNRSTRKNGSGSGGFSGGSGHGPTPPRRSSGGGGAADSGGNPFQSIWRAYNVRLAEAPILTKAFTSLVGFFLGDLIAQKFLNNTPGVGIDRARLARMASFGFLIHGPLGHHWYGALDRTIVGTTPIKVAVKVAVDQVLWAPVFTALFFSYLGLAEKKSFGEIKAKIRNDTWTGVTASWKVGVICIGGSACEARLSVC